MIELTYEQALNNLITVANQGRFTLEEGEAIKASIQKIAYLVEKESQHKISEKEGLTKED